MSYTYQAFPAWRYGPDGAAIIVNSEDETPKGFSAKRDKDPTGATAGTKTAVASPNAGTTPEKAAKTTNAVSRASVDVKKAATAGVGGDAAIPPAKAAPADKTDLDADGHAYDPSLHAATKSKTKAGLWRMKVGVARPDPVPGFSKPPLDL